MAPYRQYPTIEQLARSLLSSSERLRGPVASSHNLAVLTACSLGYMVLFTQLSPLLGLSVVLLCLLPVTFTAWHIGLRAGLLAALISVPLNLAMVYALRLTPFETATMLLSGVGLLLMAAAIGVGGLRHLVDWLLNQHAGVLDERALLQSQLAQLAASEAALRESESRYRAISELTSDYIYGLAVEPDGTIKARWVTEAFTRITGYTPAELEAGGGWASLIHPDDMAGAVERATIIFNGHDHVGLMRIITRDGRVRSVRDYARPICDEQGRVVEIIGAVHDVTEELAANQALSCATDQTMRLLQALDAASDGVVLVDCTLPDLPMTWANATFFRLTGYSPDEVLGRNCRFLQGPATDQQSVKLIREALAAGRDVTVTLLNYRKDGTTFWNELKLAPVCDDDGNPVAFVGVQTDVTARKLAEEALQASEEKLRLITSQLPSIIWTTDCNLKLTSSLGAGLTAIDTIDYRDRTIYELFGPSRQPGSPLATHEQALLGESASYELCVLGRDYETWVEPLHDGTGTIIGTLGMALDVSERKHAEEQERRHAVRATLQATISRALAEASLDSQAVLSTIVHEIANALGDCCAIRMLTPAHEEFELVAVYHADEAREEQMRAICAVPQRASEGLAGRVVSTGVPLLIPDTAAWIARRSYGWERLAQGGTASVLMVPLRARGQIQGVLSVTSDEPTRRYNAEDLIFVQDLADRAALAITNAQLYESAQRRLGYLQGLNRIDRAIATSMSLDVTFDIVVDQVIELLGVDAASLLLLDDDSQTLRFIAGRGFQSDGVWQTNLRLGEGLAGQAALQGTLVAVPDLRVPGSGYDPADILVDEGFVAYAVAPLAAKGQIIGVIEVFCRSARTHDAEWYQTLRTLAHQAAIAVENARLFGNLQRARHELALAYDATLEGWSRALDLRDNETDGHSRRVTEMTLRLSRSLGVADGELLHMRRGALLHDIGKMGIPDAILHKPGPLTAEEWQVMRRHPAYAYELLSPISFLHQALDIPYCHHEKWDGSGYPRGLKGQQIPLAARIFAVADVWDALRSDRPYRSGWPDTRVRDHIRAAAGSHFDPAVVEAFLRLGGQVAED